jgi:hypothetical protein
MAPSKKEKLNELREYAEQYKIEFEGPVGSNSWPEQHKHLFMVIQEISANRYDEYAKRKDIDKDVLERQESRIMQLRRRAARLRKDRHINEDTWRYGIEQFVVEQFGQDVVWFVTRNLSSCSSHAHF